MSDRPLKYWFDRLGNLHSASLLGTFELNINVSQDNVGSFIDFIFELYPDILDIREEFSDTATVGVFTGRNLISMDWTSDTKEGAFKLFMARVAEQAEIPHAVS